MLLRKRLKKGGTVLKVGRGHTERGQKKGKMCMLKNLKLCENGTNSTDHFLGVFRMKTLDCLVQYQRIHNGGSKLL